MKHFKIEEKRLNTITFSLDVVMHNWVPHKGSFVWIFMPTKRLSRTQLYIILILIREYKQKIYLNRL